MNMSLSDYRKLYQYYSPLKTNKTLSNIYKFVVNKSTELSDVRYNINNLICDNYWNESVIKAAFIKNHLIKKSPRLNITIFELNALESRADIAVMNGSSYVYEIKTIYDTFDRLDKQISDYTHFFDYLNVIVPIEKVDQVKMILPPHVGIIYYYKNRLGNISFKVIRKSKLNTSVNPKSQLESLTKKELLNLIGEKNNHSLIKDDIILKLLDSKTSTEIDFIYRESMKSKYYDKWNFLHNNINDIYPLDYQWFFKNNLDTKIVYK